MVDRIALYRPLTRQLLHPDIEIRPGGEDTTVLNGAGDMTFSVAPEWETAIAEDGAPYFLKRGTLVVAELANGTIQQAGLVEDFDPGADDLTIYCGGVSMLPGQAGPWEGAQGRYLTIDPVALFRRIWDQTQSYPDADLGVRVVGDTRSGSMVGDEGSARWRAAQRDYNRIKPQLDKAEAHLLNAERVLASRAERVFRAAYLNRVGDIIQREDAPDDPGFKADSTLWVNNAWRAHRWRDGRWISQSQADDAVHSWRNAVATRDRARERVEPLKYQLEPLEERLDELSDEAKEEFSLYFWQDHNMGTIIEQLTEMGPFEYREEAAWDGDDLDLRIRVGAPHVGVRREELHLELGVNIHDHPPADHGERYTGVALFGAGQGSEVLSEQRSWHQDHIVRNILTETDKDAHTKKLTRAAANRLLAQVKADAGITYTDFVIHHDAACPAGSFQVGDELYITGKLRSGNVLDGWVRVLAATHQWGTNTTSIEVEQL